MPYHNRQFLLQGYFPSDQTIRGQKFSERLHDHSAGIPYATSVGGVLTGRGADLLILDDILKPDDALSETRRRAANDWFFNTLLSRLNSKEDGAMIIVMQRLHQEDLVGEVMERERWEVLSLPAIAIEDERISFEGPLGQRVFNRSSGQALHPERDSVETYQKIRATIGEYNFQSQYQQNPMPLEGGLIKREWLQYYSPAAKPEFRMIVQSWDTANKAGELNDYSVCTTWGLCDGKFYLLHVYRMRLNFPLLKRAAKDLYERFDPRKVVIVDKASGTALIQELKAEGINGIEIYQPGPGSDKLMRLAGQAIKFEDGRVRLPEVAPGAVGAGVGATAEEASRVEGTLAAQASHGRGDPLRPGPMDGTERVLLGRRGAHR